jgi:3-methylcrotonyl-CoA carboxylase alpha subunit
LSASEASGSGSDKSRVVSPMPGVLDKMLVKPGDAVKAGDSLAVIIGTFYQILNFP